MRPAAHLLRLRCCIPASARCSSLEQQATSSLKQQQQPLQAAVSKEGNGTFSKDPVGLGGVPTRSFFSSVGSSVNTQWVTTAAAAGPAALQLQLPLLARGLTSSSSHQSSAAGAERVDLAQKVLDQGSVLALKEELQMLSEGNTMIPFSEFARLAHQAGCSRTDKEAEELCAQLQKACVVLRHRDSVYLRPEEIAEAVMMMMPSNKEEAQRTLMQLEQELRDLEQTHQQLERVAQRRTNAMLSLGLVVLTVQLAAFFYLTYYELSWDVMEPIGYMISLFYSICAYIYFLGTRGSQFDLGPFKEFWSKRILDSKKARLQFDQERWDFLMKQRDRIRKHLGLSHQVMKAVTRH